MDHLPIVSLKSISKLYGKEVLAVKAVDNVSLDIYAGDFLTLCGPSGSGKTTLLNLIGALDTPSQGELFISGKLLNALSGKELSQIRRDMIGFVFQLFNLIPVMTALENTEFTLHLQNIPKARRQEMARKALSDVGLAGLEHRRPHELSGGQQQRVAIARAIAPNPMIVIADEPTANLDSRTATSLLDLMERLNRQQGITFIFSTHDNKILNRARRVVTLQDGKKVEERFLEDPDPLLHQGAD